MSDFIFEKLSPKQFLLQLIVPFLAILFFLQGFRTYVINIYISFFNILWEGTGYYLPLLSLIAIGAPLFAIIAHKKISTRKMVSGSAFCTALFAIPISLQLSYEIELLFASLVVSFFAIFLTFHMLQRVQDTSKISVPAEAALLSTSFILAFTYDIFFRSLGITYDPSRLFTYFPFQLFLAIALFTIIVWYMRYPSNSNQPQEPSTEQIAQRSITSRLTGILIIASFGFIFFIEHTVMINPHNILRWSNPEHFLLDLLLVFALVIIIMVIGVIILTNSKIRIAVKLDKWPRIVLGNLFTIIVLVLMFFLRNSVFLVLLAQIFILVNLFTIIKYVIHPKFQWSANNLCAAIFLAMLIFILWDFMYAFTFTYAYLGDIGVFFAGQAITILLLAAIILSITSSFAAYKIGRLSI
ncbi:MAG: hypothetical protein ACFFD8_08405 [Candidatus Thorarchaeota archaeon]